MSALINVYNIFMEIECKSQMSSLGRSSEKNSFLSPFLTINLWMQITWGKINTRVFHTFHRDAYSVIEILFRCKKKTFYAGTHNFVCYLLFASTVTKTWSVTCAYSVHPHIWRWKFKQDWRLRGGHTSGSNCCGPLYCYM